MKKFQMILLSIALTAFIAACGGNTTHNHDGQAQDNAAGQTTEQQAVPTEQGPEYTSAYICPMHCEGSGSDQPGTCPACGMEYVANESYQKDADTHEHDGHEGHSH